MSSSHATVLELLEAGAPGATALSTPGGAPLTYQALRRLARDTLSALNARGIGRNDRVAIVLDNGPEMAAAFVSVAAGATAAPLNPGPLSSAIATRSLRPIPLALSALSVSRASWRNA